MLDFQVQIHLSVFFYFVSDSESGVAKGSKKRKGKPKKIQRSDDVDLNNNDLDLELPDDPEVDAILNNTEQYIEEASQSFSELLSDSDHIKDGEKYSYI